MRHAGDNRELVDPALAARSQKISPLEMTVTHELGHDMQDRYAADYAEYNKTVGWETHDAAGTGLSATDLAKLEAGRNNHYSGRVYVNDGSKDFRANANDANTYRSTHAGAIPAKGDHAIGAGGDTDTWGYARTNDNELFAEHYAKAVQVPEMLHTDLVARPEKAVADAELEIKSIELAKRADPSMSDVQRAALESKLAEVRRTLTQAQSTLAVRRGEFDIMRNQVFNTDDAQALAEARLQAKGIDKTKLEEFRARAATASTPAQLATIEALF